jgi:hypothetical protein
MTHITPVTLADIEARHVPNRNPGYEAYCAHCSMSWPCGAATAMQALRVAEAGPCQACEDGPKQRLQEHLPGLSSLLVLDARSAARVIESRPDVWAAISAALEDTDEALRMQKSWPTPNHMRRVADALDLLTPAKYGDVLRHVADACDASLEDTDE